MRKFHVVVNGERFEVEIEEVGTTPSVSTPVSEPPKAVVSPAAQPASATPKPKASGADNEVTSPLPGTVLSVNAKEGDSINSGDVIMIVEAMKMENEIIAPGGGIITGIHVKKGDSVQAGDLLFTIG
ncbi:MAG: biotin/lipoyl-containing protein [Dehalobacterium sp.]|jgi:biotin carboxyl carrier protein